MFQSFRAAERDKHPPQFDCVAQKYKKAAATATTARYCEKLDIVSEKLVRKNYTHLMTSSISPATADVPLVSAQLNASEAIEESYP